MSEQTQFYGRPMEIDAIFEHMTQKDTLEEMVFALRDWADAGKWLHDLGAPDKDDDDVWLSMVDKIKWVVENVSHDTIIEYR